MTFQVFSCNACTLYVLCILSVGKEVTELCMLLVWQLFCVYFVKSKAFSGVAIHLASPLSSQQFWHNHISHSMTRRQVPIFLAASTQKLRLAFFPQQVCVVFCLSVVLMALAALECFLLPFSAGSVLLFFTSFFFNTYCL